MGDQEKTAPGIQPRLVKIETLPGSGLFEEYHLLDYVIFGTALDKIETPEGEVQKWAPSMFMAMSKSPPDRFLQLYLWFSKKWPAVLADMFFEVNNRVG